MTASDLRSVALEWGAAVVVTVGLAVPFVEVPSTLLRQPQPFEQTELLSRPRHADAFRSFVDELAPSLQLR